MPPKTVHGPKGAVERKNALIKKGLDGLDDLSADEGEDSRSTEEPVRKKARYEVPDSLRPNKTQVQSETEATIDVSSLQFKVKDSSRTLELDVLGGWETWISVKKLLTSSSTNLEQTAHSIAEAERIISTWSHRSWKGRPEFTTATKKGGPQGRVDGGLSVPSYVQATLLLVKAQHLDQRYIHSQHKAALRTADTTGTPRRSPQGGVVAMDSLLLPSSASPSGSTNTITSSREQVVNAYSMSISRCVQIMQASGYGDALLGGSTTGSTYRQRANTLGMPEEAVEVRNEVAHGSSVPLLTQLRWVCSLVLDWLFETYWTVQEKELGKIKQQRRSETVAKVAEVKKTEGHNKAAVHAILGGKSKAPATSTPKTGSLSLAQLKEKMSGAAKRQADPDHTVPPPEGPKWVTVCPNSPWSVVNDE